MPRLVKPEDESSFAQPKALASRSRSKGKGFDTVAKPKTWKASPQIFPVELTPELEKQLKEMVDNAVKTYGERSLPELDAEERIAIAAEKRPHG